MQGSHILEAKHLSKTIKKTKIIHDVSVVVKSKEIVGLLGQMVQGKVQVFI